MFQILPQVPIAARESLGLGIVLSTFGDGTVGTSRRVPNVRRRTRRSASTVGGGTPDMTIGLADADHAGARPYLHRHETSRIFSPPAG